MLGRTEIGTDLWVDLAEPYHWAIQGQTRSGKSKFVSLILAKVAPFVDRRVTVLAGTDLSALLLAPFARVSPEGWIATGSTAPDRHLQVLENLVCEMDERLSELANVRTDSLLTFTTDFPLLLVVLEEYPGLPLTRFRADWLDYERYLAAIDRINT